MSWVIANDEDLYWPFGNILWATWTLVVIAHTVAISNTVFFMIFNVNTANDYIIEPKDSGHCHGYTLFALPYGFKRVRFPSSFIVLPTSVAPLVTCSSDRWSINRLRLASEKCQIVRSSNILIAVPIPVLIILKAVEKGIQLPLLHPLTSDVNMPHPWSYAVENSWGNGHDWSSLT